MIDERLLHTIVKRVDHSNVFRMGEGGLGSDVPQSGPGARGLGHKVSQKLKLISSYLLMNA